MPFSPWTVTSDFDIIPVLPKGYEHAGWLYDVDSSAGRLAAPGIAWAKGWMKKRLL